MLSQNDLMAIEAAFTQQITNIFGVYIAEGLNSPEKAAVKLKNALRMARDARQLAMNLMEEIED